MTKVLVVDDNAIVRAGLQAVLGRVDTVTEVLEAENALTALEMTSAHSPDIILLDVSMPPGRSGLDILPELVGSASVIMLTSMKDPALIRRALDAGARGYLVHGQLGVNEVAGAIETCRHGGLVLGREAADVMLHPSDDNRPNPLRERLTVPVRANGQELPQRRLPEDRRPQPLRGRVRLVGARSGALIGALAPAARGIVPICFTCQGDEQAVRLQAVI